MSKTRSNVNLRGGLGGTSARFGANNGRVTRPLGSNYMSGRATMATTRTGGTTAMQDRTNVAPRAGTAARMGKGSTNKV